MRRLWLPAGLLLLLAIGPALPGGGGAVLQPASARSAGGDIVFYTLQDGDTLPAIARSWFIDAENWRALQALNRIADPQAPGSAGTTLKVRRDWLRVQLIEARVNAFRGTVHHVRDGVARPVDLSTRLREGDRLRTGRDGFVTLMLPDNSRISLPSASHIRIARLRRLPMSQEVDRRFELEAGHADARVTPMTNPQSRFHIRTPVAVAAVRGTRFGMTYTPDSRTATTEVTEGRVLVRHHSGAAELLLTDGQGVVAVADHLGPAIALRPAPVLLPEAITQERNLVRIRMQPVTDAVRYVADIAIDAEFDDRIARLESVRPVMEFRDLPDGRYHLRVAAVDGHGLVGHFRSLSLIRARPAGAGNASKDGSRSGLLGLEQVVMARSVDANTALLQDAVALSAPDVPAIVDAGDDMNGAADLPFVADFGPFGSDGLADIHAMSGSLLLRRSGASGSQGGSGTAGGSGGSGSTGGSGGNGSAGNGSGNDPGNGLPVDPTDPIWPPEETPSEEDPWGNPETGGGTDEAGSGTTGPGHSGPGEIVDPRPSAPIPEPTAWILMIAGFGLTGGLLRYRRRRVPVMVTA